MTIKIQSLNPEKRQSCPEEFSFGVTFSDHMFTQEFDQDKGWHNALISPYHSLVLEPSAAVFHYSKEIFE